MNGIEKLAFDMVIAEIERMACIELLEEMANNEELDHLAAKLYIQKENDRFKNKMDDYL